MRHRRAVLRVNDESIIIIDRLNSNALHTYRLHWLLSDCPYFFDSNRDTLQLKTDAGNYYVVSGAEGNVQSSLIRADPDSSRGWCSHYYMDLQPALSLELEIRSSNQIFLDSVFT